MQHSMLWEMGSKKPRPKNNIYYTLYFLLIYAMKLLRGRVGRLGTESGVIGVGIRRRVRNRFLVLFQRDTTAAHKVQTSLQGKKLKEGEEKAFSHV